MSDEEKIQEAKKLKEFGNAFFKAGSWSRAVKKYKSAGSLIDQDVSAPLSAVPTLRILSCM